MWAWLLGAIRIIADAMVEALAGVLAGKVVAIFA